MSGSAGVRERLAAERRAAQERLRALQLEFGGLVDAGDRTNIDDEHDPEGATIAFERAQVAALIERAEGRLRELDHALEAVGSDTYGSCERCGRLIAPGRLQARPSATTCVDCAAGRISRP